MTESARYLYAIARGLDPDALDARGIDDGALEVVSHRGLDAVVSDVDLAEFDEQGLQRNLEDLGWLERVARRHDEVVNAVARLAPVAPLRLATICLADNGVRRRLDEWHDGLTAALDRVAGCSEWSVKLVTPPRSAAPAGATAAATSGPGAGAAYLKRRKDETTQRTRDDDEALTQAQQVYERLAGVAVAGRRLQPQDPRLSGLAGTMTLNAAFLVDDGDQDTFTALVGELTGSLPDGAVHVGGPWPPYSFATLDQP